MTRLAFWGVMKIWGCGAELRSQLTSTARNIPKGLPLRGGSSRSDLHKETPGTSLRVVGGKPDRPSSFLRRPEPPAGQAAATGWCRPSARPPRPGSQERGRRENQHKPRDRENVPVS